MMDFGVADVIDPAIQYPVIFFLPNIVYHHIACKLMS